MKNTYKIKIKLLNANCIPTKSNPNDVGYDLKASIDNNKTIYPGERYLINTGIIMDLPKDIEAQIRPRSGLAINNGITILNSPGTIDPGFTGEIKIILINLGNENYIIKKYDKIAQLVFKNIIHTRIVISKNINKNSSRGTKGFGSTDNIIYPS